MCASRAPITSPGRPSSTTAAACSSTAHRRSSSSLATSARREFLVRELLVGTPTPQRQRLLEAAPPQPRADPPTPAQSSPTPRTADRRPRPPRPAVGSPARPSRPGPLPNPPRRRDTSVWSVCEALAGGTSPQSAVDQSIRRHHFVGVHRQIPPIPDAAADRRASAWPHARITSRGPRIDTDNGERSGTGTSGQPSDTAAGVSASDLRPNVDGIARPLRHDAVEEPDPPTPTQGGAMNTTIATQPSIPPPPPPDARLSRRRGRSRSRRRGRRGEPDLIRRFHQPSQPARQPRRRRTSTSMLSGTSSPRCPSASVTTSPPGSAPPFVPSSEAPSKQSQPRPNPTDPSARGTDVASVLPRI